MRQAIGTRKDGSEKEEENILLFMYILLMRWQ